jgi:Mn2+/Fe2+ NRAMP family transporter
LVVAFQWPGRLAGDDAPQAALGVTAALAFGGAAGMEAWVSGWVGGRTGTMVGKARLGWRSPPRLSR